MLPPRSQLVPKQGLLRRAAQLLLKGSPLPEPLTGIDKLVRVVVCVVALALANEHAKAT